MQAKKVEFTHVAVARPFEFTNDERCLLVEALNRAATRQESESRFNPRNASPHDLKAARMRKLAARIAKGGVVAALFVFALLPIKPAVAYECTYVNGQEICSGDGHQIRCSYINGRKICGRDY